MKKQKLTILYQADCGFCNWYRDFVSGRTVKGELDFIDIASDDGKAHIDRLSIPVNPNDPSTFVVINEEEKIYYRWKACMKVGIRLKSPWKQLSYLGHLLPSIIGDQIYNLVSRNRSLAGRIVGRSDTCDI